MKYTCLCCGYKTLDEPAGNYDICPVCFWEDDPFVEGGANRMSLVKGQRNYNEFGACEREMIKNVRKPTENDERDSEWKMIELREDRVYKITINLSEVSSKMELHALLKVKLEFTEFYGMNWDAFWDEITGLITMPIVLEFENWINLERKLPKESKVLKRLLEEYNSYYTDLECEIYYN